MAFSRLLRSSFWLLRFENETNIMKNIYNQNGKNKKMQCEEGPWLRKKICI